ncbi:unnamed protein product [Prorocentrum cordatum]|uniref:Uncharacterized protein n=1 Tax=Prorocentrum cordatum TaxID=2364126 RepID=A0ABN9V0A4_9DINO|nr:unnamed protein product [Polarella glacialis]
MRGRPPPAARAGTPRPPRLPPRGQAAGACDDGCAGRAACLAGWVRQPRWAGKVALCGRQQIQRVLSCLRISACVAGGPRVRQSSGDPTSRSHFGIVEQIRRAASLSDASSGPDRSVVRVLLPDTEQHRQL